MDKFSKKKRSEIMSRVKARDTKPELLVRKICSSLGYRYRLHSTKLPGKPDLVFKKLQKVIFVHGCFWHGHDCKSGQKRPTTNFEYWKSKLDRNIERDKKNQRSLKNEGWRYLLIWGCETRAKNISALIPRIDRFLKE